MENRNVDIGKQDSLSSPPRRVLGDIKNVSEDPPSPVSPTANLKLLTRVASHFRKRDFGDDTSSLDSTRSDSQNVDENLETVIFPKKPSGTTKPRKEKSLSLLCDKFLELYPLELTSDSIMFISLDQAAAQLRTERRRLYDIINVLESLQMASKIGKNSYQWYGNQQLLGTLGVLKGMAEKMGYRKKVKAMQNYCYCYPKNQEKDIISTPNNQQTECGRDERSLGVLCQKFLMLFLVADEADFVILEVAARVVLANPESETTSDTEEIFPLYLGMGTTQLKAKARRLYDIANVLISLKLIRKVYCSDSVRKPAFAYCGPKVDSTSKFKGEEISPFYPTRHSLLRPRYVEYTIYEKEKSPIGEVKRKLKRTYSDSMLLPSSDCQLSQKVCEQESSTNCFGEAILTVCVVDNSESDIKPANSALADNQKDNKILKSTTVLDCETADQFKKITSNAGTSVFVKQDRNIQTAGDKLLMHKHSQLGSELCGTKLIRHHSESCVGKTSLCVKRKLVKVAPLSTEHNNNNKGETRYPEGMKINQRPLFGTPQSAALNTQHKSSCVVTPTINQQIFIPYPITTNCNTAGVYVVDQQCIKTPDITPVTGNEPCVSRNKQIIPFFTQAISGPTVNQPRVLLTEDMLKNGKRLTNYGHIPAQGVNFSKRQLLPKGFPSDKQNLMQSSSTGQLKIDEVGKSKCESNSQYQSRWKPYITKNDSHILSRDILCSTNNSVPVISQNNLGPTNSTYSVGVEFGTGDHNNVQSISLQNRKQDNQGNDLSGVSAIKISGNSDSHFKYTDNEGSCKTRQNFHFAHTFPHLATVSEDHCYNRLQEGNALQTPEHIPGISADKIVLPHMVPGELYTPVKVGSVLQLVPVSSNSLVTKM